nr:MAG TPA: hypothetical protein [Caudoviricetes sp.]
MANSRTATSYLKTFSLSSSVKNTASIYPPFPKISNCLLGEWNHSKVHLSISLLRRPVV